MIFFAFLLTSFLNATFAWQLFGEFDKPITAGLGAKSFVCILRFGPTPAEVQEHFRKKKAAKSEEAVSKRRE